jgi:hypothetical protein
VFSLRSLFEVIETYVDRLLPKEYNDPPGLQTSCNETPIDAHARKTLPCHRQEFHNGGTSISFDVRMPEHFNLRIEATYSSSIPPPA